MGRLIPSSAMPNAAEALCGLATDAVSISAAVAFVTESGVSELVRILDGRHDVEVEICARGAPITEQAALVRLRDELNAMVTLVMGPEALHFHPKLWLVRSPTTLSVLAGSGNLTDGGLVANVEQFDLNEYAHDSAAAQDQERRLAHVVR